VTVLTTKIGQGAEERVAKLLEKAGFKILARNWRTKVCEIDIVARKNKIIYFVEVKYRSSLSQGSGFEYITPKKLNQMRFAAEIWIQQNSWENDYRLAAAELSEEKGSIKIVELE
jgi:uncharacterized protein (TIGR00252 family)